jgi:hypothetical protein
MNKIKVLSRYFDNLRDSAKLLQAVGDMPYIAEGKIVSMPTTSFIYLQLPNQLGGCYMKK